MPQNFRLARSSIRTLLVCATLAITPAHASLCGEFYLNLLAPRVDAPSFTETLKLNPIEQLKPEWRFSKNDRVQRIVGSSNEFGQTLIAKLHAAGIDDLILVDNKTHRAFTGFTKVGPFLVLASGDDLEALVHQADHLLRLQTKFNELRILYPDNEAELWAEFEQWFLLPATDVIIESRAVEATLRIRKNLMVATSDSLAETSHSPLQLSNFFYNQQLERTVSYPQRATLMRIWKTDYRLKDFSNELRSVRGEDTTRLITQYLKAYPDLFETVFALADESFRKILSIRLAEVNKLKSIERTDPSVEGLISSVASLRNLDLSLFDSKPLGSPEFVYWVIETRFPIAWEKLKNRFPAHFEFELPLSPR